jgi:hypothetical protein
MIKAIDFGEGPLPEPKARRKLTELEIFFIKVGAVLTAVLIFFFVAAAFLKPAFRRLEILRGGPAFWAQVERKLYSLADEPDLPEEKKTQIIRALEKVSHKYQPYIEALSKPSSK